MAQIDLAQAYYWRMQFLDPADPEDDRYVMLYGDEGEVVGPLTRAMAEAWIERFEHREQA